MAKFACTFKLRGPAGWGSKLYKNVCEPPEFSLRSKAATIDALMGLIADTFDTVKADVLLVNVIHRESGEAIVDLSPEEIANNTPANLEEPNQPQLVPPTKQVLTVMPELELDSVIETFGLESVAGISQTDSDKRKKLISYFHPEEPDGQTKKDIAGDDTNGGGGTDDTLSGTAE